MHRPLSYRKLQNGTQGCANPNLSINHPPRIQFKCIVRAQNNAIFRAASRVSWWQEAGGGEGRTGPHTASQAEGTPQARQSGTQACTGKEPTTAHTICPPPHSPCTQNHRHSLPMASTPITIFTPHGSAHSLSVHMDLLIHSTGNRRPWHLASRSLNCCTSSLANNSSSSCRVLSPR